MGPNPRKLFTIAILAILFVLSLCSCGEKAPPHYGAFLKDGGNFIELPELEVFGRITERDVAGAPVAPDSHPVVALWRQGTRLEYLMLYQINPFEELRYTADPKDDGVINLRPVDPLQPGYYCYYQGDPLGMGLPAWCFEVQ